MVIVNIEEWLCATRHGLVVVIFFGLRDQLVSRVLVVLARESGEIVKVRFDFGQILEADKIDEGEVVEERGGWFDVELRNAKVVHVQCRTHEGLLIERVEVQKIGQLEIA